MPTHVPNLRLGRISDGKAYTQDQEGFSVNPPEINLDMSKPYTIEFHGGPSVGVVVRTDSDNEGEKVEAMGALFLTALSETS